MLNLFQFVKNFLKFALKNKYSYMYGVSQKSRSSLGGGGGLTGLSDQNIKIVSFRDIDTFINNKNFFNFAEIKCFLHYFRTLNLWQVIECFS